MVMFDFLNCDMYRFSPNMEYSFRVSIRQKKNQALRTEVARAHAQSLMEQMSRTSSWISL